MNKIKNSEEEFDLEFDLELGYQSDYVLVN